MCKSMPRLQSVGFDSNPLFSKKPLQAALASDPALHCIEALSMAVQGELPPPWEGSW